LFVIVIHPPPPTVPHLAAIRDRAFAIVGDLVRASKLPTIVIGDFNAAPWTQPLRGLFAQTELRALSRWPMLTFTSIYPWPLRIPIDHVLIGPGIAVESVKLGAAYGSDHLPLIARLRLN
jgi:endonuclease/exonuclease/phosphatase (EEP) superfamily protein YafD